MHEAISEIDRNLEIVGRNVETLNVAKSGEKLRIAWENYLFSFGRTIGRLISFGHKQEALRGWAHSLKNRSSKDDPGLVFLREARNFAEHGLSPCADFRGPGVEAGGGAILIGGNASAVFEGNIVNGVPMGDFQLTTNEGRIQHIDGRPNIPLVEVPGAIYLIPIQSEEKNKFFPIPTSIDGVGIDQGNPEDLAVKSLQFLRKKRTEMDRLLGVR